MGTDIHGIFQAKISNIWTDIPSLYDQDRHYQLFAVLAGIRNGSGFAGVPTGDIVIPISEPRGLPDGMSSEFKTDIIPYPSYEKYDDEDDLYYLGDHNYSWLTGEEMYNWYLNAPVLTKVGIITREQYEEWDKISPPKSYAGDTWGHNVIKVTEETKDKIPNWTNIYVSWKRDLKEELAYFFDEIKRLIHEYGEIRFIFGFDS